jgi:glutathione S-transferase
MKLYHMPGACSLADIIVLAWIGAPHETVRMSTETLKSPDYLAINAGGTVPLLRHGDFALTENVAILGYLADLHPEAQLLGDGTPRARAEVMRWLGFLNSDVHKAFKPIFVPGRFLPDRAQANALADTARGHVRAYLERLDAQLDGRDWLTGQRSVADPYLFVLSRWAVGKKVPLHGLDNLARFSERMYADQGVQAALAAELTAA